MRRETYIKKRSKIDTLSLVLVGFLNLTTLILVCLCVLLFVAGLVTMKEKLIYASLFGSVAMTWINSRT